MTETDTNTYDLRTKDRPHKHLTSSQEVADAVFWGGRGSSAFRIGITCLYHRENEARINSGFIAAWILYRNVSGLKTLISSAVILGIVPPFVLHLCIEESDIDFKLSISQTSCRVTKVAHSAPCHVSHPVKDLAPCSHCKVVRNAPLTAASPGFPQTFQTACGPLRDSTINLGKVSGCQVCWWELSFLDTFLGQV